MPAPEGNQYWKLRTKHGKDKKYTVDKLQEESNKYFQWCQDNPLLEETILKYKDSYEKVNLSKMRPFTISGLCNYLDISVETFSKYEKNQDYVVVVTRIRQIIYNQKFEGAAAGFLNPNIIARDLGLVDKKQQEIKVEQPLFPESED